MGFTTKAIEALIYEVLKSQVGNDLAKEKLAQARKSSQNSLTKYGYIEYFFILSIKKHILRNGKLYSNHTHDELRYTVK